MNPHIKLGAEYELNGRIHYIRAIVDEQYVIVREFVALKWRYSLVDADALDSPMVKWLDTEPSPGTRAWKFRNMGRR